MTVKILDNHFLLLPDRAVFWQEQSMLILSDTHFGKVTHFRKSGIAIPTGSFYADIDRLDRLVAIYHPVSLMIVGDMFHSVYNHEIAHFASWRDRYRGLEIYLAKGNHDILAADIYHSLNIKVGRTYTFGDIAFSHDLCADISCFCFNGHIHPGIRIVSNARQQLKFSCFHFSGMNCTLPAFSLFTGLSIISPLPDDKVYMIVDDEVIPV